MKYPINIKTLVMAFAAMTMGMSLYSCGDDDDDNGNGTIVTPPDEEQVAEGNRLDSVEMRVTFSASQDVVDLFHYIYLRGWRQLDNPYESENAGKHVTAEEKTFRIPCPADRLPATISARVQTAWQPVAELKSSYNLNYDFDYKIIAYYRDGHQETVTEAPFINEHSWYHYSTTLYNPTLDVLKQEIDYISSDLRYGYSSFIRLNKKVENGKEVVTVYNFDEKQYITE